MVAAPVAALAGVLIMAEVKLELRDLFAAHALTGILANQDRGTAGRRAAAREAFACADAMLKARGDAGDVPPPASGL